MPRSGQDARGKGTIPARLAAKHAALHVYHGPFYTVVVRVSASASRFTSTSGASVPEGVPGGGLHTRPNPRRTRPCASKREGTSRQVAARVLGSAAPPEREASPLPDGRRRQTGKLSVADEQTIRIRLKAYDHNVVDESSRKIAETVLRTQAKIKGPVPLPTEIHRYCVIRGPHVHKDSREHFEMRIHKRLIDIPEPTPKTVDSLMRLELPAGVEVEIKL